MILNKKIIIEYQNNGVAMLKILLTLFGYEYYQQVSLKILKIQVNTNAFMKKQITKNYFMMITVTGKKLMNIKILLKILI